MKKYFFRPTCFEGSQQAKDLNGPGLLLTMKLDQEQRKNARKRAERYKQNLEKGEKVEA